MINVQDYGAVGDGVHWDGQSIQAALDVGGWVFVPAGTYRLGAALRIRERTRLTLAPGAVMLRDSQDGILSNTPAGSEAGGYTAAGGIVIEGGVWDVNGVDRPAYACGIAIGHSEDVTIRDLTIRNTPGWHALEINSSRSVLVDNCRFEGFTHAGDRNFSEAIQLDAALGPETGSVPYDGTVCDGVEVRSCRFGGGGAPGTAPWPRAVGTHTAPATWHRNIRIVNNVIDSPSWCGIRAYWWDRAVITGNQVVNSSGDGIVVDYSSRYVEVHGNQVVDSGRNGILVDHDCTQIDIRDNMVIGSGQAAHNAYGGIRVADSNYVRLVGNTARRRMNGSDARYGMWIEASAGGIQRHGNDCRYGGYSGNVADFSSGSVTSAADAT